MGRSAWVTEVMRLASTNAPINSRREIVSPFSGATLVFEAIRCVEMPCEVSARR